MRTRNEHKEQLVEEKALELLVTHGFDGFSMQKLAKAANVSPATLYIYYKDKEDLITQLGMIHGTKMVDVTLEGFDPHMSFEDGLRLQWRNRARYWLENPMEAKFFDLLSHTPYHKVIAMKMNDRFREVMTVFGRNAVEKNELVRVPFEVYWSIAFAPLYNLIRFHFEGQSKGGKPFTWSDEIMEQTLSLVIKALKP